MSKCTCGGTLPLTLSSFSVGHAHAAVLSYATPLRLFRSLYLVIVVEPGVCMFDSQTKLTCVCGGAARSMYARGHRASIGGSHHDTVAHHQQSGSSADQLRAHTGHHAWNFAVHTVLKPPQVRADVEGHGAHARGLVGAAAGRLSRPDRDAGMDGPAAPRQRRPHRRTRRPL